MYARLVQRHSGAVITAAAAAQAYTTLCCVTSTSRGSGALRVSPLCRAPAKSPRGAAPTVAPASSTSAKPQRRRSPRKQNQLSQPQQANTAAAPSPLTSSQTAVKVRKGKTDTRSAQRSSPRSPVASKPADGSPSRLTPPSPSPLIVPSLEESEGAIGGAAGPNNTSSSADLVEVHLDELVREWVVLRRRCSWQMQHGGSTVSGSSPGSFASTTSTLARSPHTAASSTTFSTAAQRVRDHQPAADADELAIEEEEDALLAAADVHAAERAVLLTTLSNDPAAYPQLYRFLCLPPQSPSSSHASQQQQQQQQQQQPQQQVKGRSTPVSSKPSSAEPAAFSTADVHVSGVSALLSREACAMALLTLLRVNAPSADHVAQSAQLQAAVWTAYTAALEEQLQHDLAHPSVGSRGTVAQVLHLLVDVHRSQLAISVASGKAEGKKPNSKAAESNGADNAAAPAKRRRRAKAPRSTAPAYQQRNNAAAQTRVCDVLTRLVEPTRQLFALLLQSVAAPRTAAATHEEAASSGPTCGDATLLLMGAAISAVAVEAGSFQRTSRSAQAIVDVPALASWRDDALQQLVVHLQQLHAPGAAEQRDAAAAASVFADMLQCFRWIEEVEVVLPAATRSRIEDLCQRTLRDACRSADVARGVDLLEHLCRPHVPRALRRLQPHRMLYTQAITDVCTVAAAYLQRCPERVAQLVDQLEQRHRTRMQGSSGKAAHSSGSSSVPPRPPLHSSVAQLLYAMLCAGFPAASLLTSGLCLTLSPRDTLDVVRAANLFSSSCATAPLPVHTRATVVEQTWHLLMQCQRDSHRVIVSTMDADGDDTEAVDREGEGSGGGEASVEAEAAFSLAARLADGATTVVNSAAAAMEPLPSSPPSRKGRRHGKSKAPPGALTPSGPARAFESGRGGGEGGGGGGAAAAVLTPAMHRRQVNHVLSISVDALVQSLLRGDVAAVQKLGPPLLQLLQQEGQEAALTQALDQIWSDLCARMTEVGSCDVLTQSRDPGLSTASAPRRGSHQTYAAATAVTSPLMEHALALLPALFLPRLTESALSLWSAGSSSTSASAWTATRLTHRETVREMALQASTICILCGMAPDTATQLTTLHNSLLKVHGEATHRGGGGGEGELLAEQQQQTNGNSSGSNDADGRGAGVGPSPAAAVAENSSSVSAAFAVVERLERLLTELSRRALPWTRHTASMHVRHGGAAVQQVLALYIGSTAPAVREMTTITSSSSTGSESSKDRQADSAEAVVTSTRVVQQYRRYLLTVVHLLYRLSTEYPVETEPAVLRVFRVDVLDLALTSLLAASPSSLASSSTTAAASVPLTTLTEIMVVMCVPATVQHVSPALVRGVVTSVEQHLKARAQAAQTTASKSARTRTSAAASLPLLPVADTVSGVLVTQLLRSAATLCLRADDALTNLLLQLLDRLSPLLTLPQTMSVLEQLQSTNAPLPAPPVRCLIERLVEALRGSSSSNNNGRSSGGARSEKLSLALRVRAVHLLGVIQQTAEGAAAEQRWPAASTGDDDVAALMSLLHSVPYGSLLKTMLAPSQLQRHTYTVGECGLLVEVSAHLSTTDNRTIATTTTTTAAAAAAQGTGATSSGDSQQQPQPLQGMRHLAGDGLRFTIEEHAVVASLPRTVAAYVLQVVQTPYDLHDIPLLLRGYAALSHTRADTPLLQQQHRHLQQQMLHAFIARTMRAAAILTPAEVVMCVEAYALSGVYHQQLYGVLLGRVADMGRKLTLDLSVRLLQCSSQAGHASVRTVCVTAVQPIFTAQVRGLLHSDPHMLVSVASTALEILHCLRQCFPHDEISAAVLANVARYHYDASLSVVKAALQLAEQRGSVDYDAVHVLARHCTEKVLPASSAVELTNVTCLLLACGLRSQTLTEATHKRLVEVIDTMPGASLAKLAQGLMRASVEVDPGMLQLLCERAVQLTNGSPATAAAASDVRKKEQRSSKGRPQPSDSRTAAAIPSPTPLTIRQVCVMLLLLRSVGSRLLTTAMTTVDALLAYTQARVLAELADVEEQAKRSEGSSSAANAVVQNSSDTASTQQPAEDASEQLRDDDSTALSSAAAFPDTSSLPPPLALFTGLSPREVEGMLRTCIELSSKPKAVHQLVHCLADYTAHLLVGADANGSGDRMKAAGATLTSSPSSRMSDPSQRFLDDALLSPTSSARAAASSSSAAAAAWQTDLILLVDLCSLFVRLGETDHVVVPLLLSVLYERRGTLLQRALLVKSIRQSLEMAGRAAHPELYKLVVDGEVL